MSMLYCDIIDLYYIFLYFNLYFLYFLAFFDCAMFLIRPEILRRKV